MNGDSIDASIGLAFSLRLFANYRQTGILHATIRSVPGIKGPCEAFLELTNGQVLSCYLEDKTGQRYSTNVANLCQLDEEKGPFEWKLESKLRRPGSSSPHSPDTRPLSPSHITQSIPSTRGSPVPQRLVTHLDQQHLQIYTPWQRSVLLTVFSLVNGQRTLEQISGSMQLPSAKVEEALRVLITMKAIIIA